MQKLKGRTAAVDWAVAKADFQTSATATDALAEALIAEADPAASDALVGEVQGSTDAQPDQEGSPEAAAPAAKPKKVNKRLAKEAAEEAAPVKKPKKDKAEASEQDAFGLSGQAPELTDSGQPTEQADDEGTMQAAVIQQLLQVQPTAALHCPGLEALMLMHLQHAHTPVSS